MILWKAHGLGNDYLVLEQGTALDVERVRALCDRHTGVGGDGVLEPGASERADHGVTIWNPDGSIAEKSGNGLRIFARWLVDMRGAPATFTVDTGAEIVGCTVTDDAVELQMGRARLEPAAIGLDSPAPWRDREEVVAGDRLILTAISMGNPHCVAFVEAELDGLPWRRWGEALEVHPAFANRTNVQVARVLDRHRLALRIWERGAGETLASGTSSCAAAAAGVVTGRLDAGAITAEMPGGTLAIDVSPELDVRMRGPVVGIARIEVASTWPG